MQQSNGSDIELTAPTVFVAEATGAAEERSGQALRHAATVLAEIEADEVAAAAARISYEGDGLPHVEPDGRIASELRVGERVHVVRQGALLNGNSGSNVPGYAGTLYLTSERLVHVGSAVFSVALEAVDEISVVGERLLLTLSSGEGISIDVAGPRLLRVQIGTARKAAHG